MKEYILRPYGISHQRIEKGRLRGLISHIAASFLSVPDPEGTRAED